MPLPLWSGLEKDLDDPETIEEAIVRLIGEHEADPEAHLGDGESLEMHKTEGMIDHPAGSVAVDKFAQARVLITCFESIDGWLTWETGSGQVIHEFGAITLWTGTTINSNVWLYAVPSGWIAFDTAKQFFWKATIRITATTEQEIRFGVGAPGGGEGFSGAGFEVEDGNLYAYTDDGEDVDRTQITGITLNNWNIYEVRYFPATDTWEFYVNGVLEHSEVRVFTEPQSDEIAIFRIKNTEAASKFMYISDMMFQQER